ncbi:MAG TPA: gliding motility-associated C-terminal domain-containing protein [Edaphocola sp.]|nr:gliding motility-associated C-terminal domain-containing protein [Edaphocola sp.]
MKKHFTFILFWAFMIYGGLKPNDIFAHEHGSITPFNKSNTKEAPISFIENKGQWDDGSKYRISIPNGLMRLTPKGFIYNFRDAKDLEKANEAMEANGANIQVKGHTYLVNFVGASSNSKFVGQQRQANYSNYFIGNEAKKWASNVGHFQEVLQQDVYSGIDLKLFSEKDKIKYDFIVKKESNPNLIKLAFEGVAPKIQKDGSLKIVTSVNQVIEEAPYSYQIINGREVPVASRYKITDGQVSFEFPNGYNHNYDLIIDPNLIFATYSGGGMGGSNYYYAHSTAYDKQGNTYAAALATSPAWPTTPGAFMANFTSGYIASINKYSVTGANLLYSTYFGASGGATEPNALRVNDNDELVIAGSVNNPTLPVTTGAYQTTLSGGSDIYVAKFNTTGTGLIGSTYIGGSANEASVMGSTAAQTGLGSAGGNPADIAFDDNGNIWISSNSGSSNFPVTANAFQSTLSGSHDAVLVKFNPNLTSVFYSTFYGGSAWDGSIGLDFNKTDNTIGMVGRTSSTNFPVSAGVYQSTYQGGTMDGFAVLFNNATYQRVAATFIGTSGNDAAFKVAFDCGNNMFVSGTTTGSFPVTNTAAQGMVSNGPVYIIKLNQNLTSSIASTRTATSSALPTAMMVDICGNVLVATIRSSAQTGMPLTPDAFDVTPRSFYFAGFKPNFQGLSFGSYYGNTGEHFHTGMSRMDPKGVVYQSVCATTNTFPTTPGSWSPNKQNAGANDLITFKFDFEVINLEATTESGYAGYGNLPHAVRGCKSAFIHYKRGGDTTIPMVLRFNIPQAGPSIGINGTDYQYVYDSLVFNVGESSKSLEIKPLLVPNMPTGQRMVIVEALNPCGCEGLSGPIQNVVRRDTVYIKDSIRSGISQPLPAYCPGTQITITGDVDTGLDFSWTPQEYNNGSLVINPILLTTRDYVLTATQPGAPATCPPHKSTFHALVEQYPVISMSSDTTVCVVDSVPLPVVVSPDTVNYIYNWNPPTGLRAGNIAANYFKLPVGTYTYIFSARTPIANCQTNHKIIIRVRPPFEFTDVLPPSGTQVAYLDEVNMSAQGAYIYTWLPTEKFVDPTMQYPTTLPVTESGYYYVTGIDKYGCKDTAAVYLNVKFPDDPQMPNAFTPNGDGKNDVFSIPNGKYQKLQKFEIYNRWGKRVFYTHNPLNGWDGVDENNGKPCEQGVYMYIITFELPNKEMKTFKGDLTLIR